MAVVVAVEHLDGSAVAAKYRDENGRRRWITHAFAERPFDDTPIADRSKQLTQVTTERVDNVWICFHKTLPVLEQLLIEWI